MAGKAGNEGRYRICPHGRTHHRHIEVSPHHETKGGASYAHRVPERPEKAVQAEGLRDGVGLPLKGPLTLQSRCSYHGPSADRVASRVNRPLPYPGHRARAIAHGDDAQGLEAR